MSEIWKDIPGYVGLYQASNWGDIRNSDGLILSQRYRRSEYCRNSRGHGNDHLAVDLYKNGKRKTFSVHTLVLMAFKGKRPKGMVGCHRNDDAQDNRLRNLKWGTPLENLIHAYKNGRRK